MRYILLVFLSACTFPPQNPPPTVPLPISPPIEISAPREEQKEVKKQKPKPAQTSSEVPGMPQCTDLDTDDVLESINLKLDCLLEIK